MSAHERPISPALVLEAGFAALVILFYSGALLPLLRQPYGQNSVTLTSNAADTWINAIVFAVSLALIASDVSRFTTAVRELPSIWLLPLLAMSSVFWSSDPVKTVHAGASLTAAMLFASCFALRLSSRDQILTLAMALAIAMVGSVALALSEPSLGIDVGVHAGQWRGIYLTKNAFGRTMALAATIYSLVVIYGGAARLLGVLFWCFAVVLVVLSQSRTSMAAVAVLSCFVIAQPALKRIRIPRFVLLLGMLAVGAIVALLVWIERDQLRLGVADQDSLTGRTLLWGVVGLKILKKPLLGYGYQAFWGGRSGDYVEVWKAVNWSPPHAHDGWLDVALDFGLVGYLVFAIAAASALDRALQLIRQHALPPLARVWPSVGMVFVLVTNLTESTFVRSNLYWILFTACAMAAAAAVESHKWTADGR